MNLNAQAHSVKDPKAEVFQASASDPLNKKMEVLKIPESELMDKSDAIINAGAKCKRPSCGIEYVGNESRTEECIYHEGSPVFHVWLYYLCENTITWIYRKEAKVGHAVQERYKVNKYVYI